MARLYFHLRAGETYVPDLVGCDLEDSRACARHVMEILQGVGTGDHRGWMFEITDESGEFLDMMKVEELFGAIH